MPESCALRWDAASSVKIDWNSEMPDDLLHALMSLSLHVFECFEKE